MREGTDFTTPSLIREGSILTAVVSTTSPLVRC